MGKATIEHNGKTINIEGNPDQIKEAVAQITGYQGGAKSSNQESDPGKNLGRNISASGPNAVQQLLTPGGSPEDVAGLLSSLVQGASARLPTNVAQRPMLSAAGGPGSAQLAAGTNMPGELMDAVSGGRSPIMIPVEKNQLPDLPTPVTETGKKLATPLELLGSLIGPGQAGYRGMKQIAQEVKMAAESKDVNFASKVRSAIFDLPKRFSEEFGSALDDLENQNPSQTIDISNEISDLASEMKQNSDLMRRVALGIKKFGDAEVKDIFNKMASGGVQGVAGSEPVQLTLRQTQKIVRALKQAPGLGSKLSRAGSSFDANEIPIIQAIGDIREKQLSAFPQFADSLAKYADKINNYKSVRGLFKFGQTIGKIKGSFGDPEIETAVMSLLPKQMVKEIGGIRRAVQIVKYAKQVASASGIASAIGATGVGGAYLAKKLLQ